MALPPSPVCEFCVYQECSGGNFWGDFHWIDHHGFEDTELLFYTAQSRRPGSEGRVAPLRA